MRRGLQARCAGGGAAARCVIDRRASRRTHTLRLPARAERRSLRLHRSGEVDQYDASGADGGLLASREGEAADGEEVGGRAEGDILVDAAFDLRDRYAVQRPRAASVRLQARAYGFAPHPTGHRRAGRAPVAVGGAHLVGEVAGLAFVREHRGAGEVPVVRGLAEAGGFVARPVDAAPIVRSGGVRSVVMRVGLIAEAK